MLAFADIFQVFIPLFGVEKIFFRSYVTGTILIESSISLVFIFYGRYETEFNVPKAPIMKKILEKDDFAARHMVVVIASVKNVNEGTSEVILSDGWYSIKAKLDLPLSRFLMLGKLFTGQKLHICGSEVL